MYSLPISYDSNCTSVGNTASSGRSCFPTLVGRPVQFGGHSHYEEHSKRVNAEFIRNQSLQQQAAYYAQQAELCRAQADSPATVIVHGHSKEPISTQGASPACQTKAYKREPKSVAENEKISCLRAAILNAGQCASKLSMHKTQAADLQGDLEELGLAKARLDGALQGLALRLIKAHGLTQALSAVLQQLSHCQKQVRAQCAATQRAPDTEQAALPTSEKDRYLERSKARKQKQVLQNAWMFN